MNDLPNLSGEHTALVTKADTAISLGSGSVPVLATPRLIAWLEAAAVAALAGDLQEGTTSVGMHVDVRHLAPTPVGGSVRAVATVTAAEGSIVTFEVEASDDHRRIATGMHTRAIVDVQRFLSRLG
jgi:predicted thioesterase